MREFSKLMAVVCVVIMCATIFGNIAAGEGQNQGNHVDVFTDQSGNLHKVWRDKVDGVFQVFYANIIKDNNTGLGQGGLQITNSIHDVNYPQFSIDNVSGYAYIIWLIHGAEEQIWYCGSPDLVNWYGDWYGGVKSSTKGNPNLDLTANDYLLEVTWKHGSRLVIEPDCDGDFISDKDDDFPFRYDLDFSPFDADAVSVDLELGISVAVDWDDDSNIKPDITPAITFEPLVGSVTPYADVTLPEGECTVVIKFKYSSDTLPHYINEKYLRIYAYDGAWRMIGKADGEFGGVDAERGYVWGITSSLSILTIADSSITDSNNNGVADIWDTDTLLGTDDGVGAGRLTIFSGDSYVPKIFISPDDTYHLTWVDDREGQPSVYYKHSTDYGQTWTTDHAISDSCLFIQHAAFAGYGNHLAVAYSEYYSYKTGPVTYSGFRVKLLRSIDGGFTWEEWLIPERSGVNPDIAVFEDNIYIVYEYEKPSGGDQPHVYLEGLWLSWTDEGEMNSEIIFYSESSAQHIVPKISVDSDRIHIVWAGYFDNCENNLYYIHKAINGAGWSTIEEITQYYGENDPNAIAFEAKIGNLYLVWAGNMNDGEYGIYGKWKCGETGLWSEDMKLTDSNIASSPDIFVTSNGVVNMVWHEEESGNDVGGNTAVYYMSLSPMISVTNTFTSGEITLKGGRDGDHTLTHNPDENYEIITEIHTSEYYYANEEVTHWGEVTQGSMISTYEVGGDYQRISGLYNQGIQRNFFSHEWIITVPSEAGDLSLYLRARLTRGDYSEIYISFDSNEYIQIGSMAASSSFVHYEFDMPRLPSYYNGFIRVNVRGYSSYSSSATIDKAILDVDWLTVSTGYSKLKHTWVMNIESPASANTLFLKGYTTPGKSFMFSYSLDNNNYINMFTLGNGEDNGNYVQYSFGSALSTPPMATTLYIRVTDVSNAIISEDNVLGSIFIDHMFIHSISEDVGEIVPPMKISSGKAVSSGYPSISINSLGKIYSVWHDFTHGNFEITAITDATSSTLQTSQAVQILAGSDDSIFTEETEFTMGSSANVPAMHKSTLLSKLKLLSHMISAKDYTAASLKIEVDIKPYIESTVTDEATRSQLLNTVNGVGNMILSSRPDPPGTIIVNPGNLGGDIDILWGAPTGGAQVSRYRIYRTSNSQLGTNINLWIYWIGRYNNKVDNPYNIAHHTRITSSSGNFVNLYYNNPATAYEDRMERWIMGTTQSNTNTNPAELAFDVTYYYAVTAWNNYGESDPKLTPKNFAAAVTPTLVTSYTPSNGATGVSRTTYIEINFNKPMIQDSVNTRFTLTNRGCTPQWMSSTQVRFYSDSALSYGTTYTATLNSHAESTDGYRIQTTTQWSFTTEPSPTFNPEIISWSPTGSEVSKFTTSIFISFSKDMHKSSVESTFSLNAEYGTAPGYAFSWPNNRELRITLSSYLSSGERYRIRVEGTATCTEGKYLDGGTWTRYFRTLIDVPTPVLTTTSEEFILTWPAISSPRTSDPYEIYYSISSSTWPTNPIAVTSGTTYAMDAIAHNLKPHTTYYFRVKAFNTAGCYGTSAHVGAECGRVDYFLDVGTASVWGENDMPFSLNDMPWHGLTLPPQTTGLHTGWSAPIFGSAPNPANWRQGTQQDYQRFFFNLGNGAENHIDYKFTFRYKATGTVTLQQQVGPNNWISLENLYGDNTWKTESIWIDHNDYYDHSIHGGWFGTNVQFRFHSMNSIYLDWIKAEPHAYYLDVMSDDFTDIEKHSPGICLHEEDWIQNEASYSGEAGSKFYVNLPYRDDIYSLIITYKSSESNTLMQWDMGSNFIKIGTLSSVSVWSTRIIKIHRGFLRDYNPDNSFINVLFKFDKSVDIQSITLRTHRDYSVVPEWAPMDQLIMTLPPMAYKDDLWPMYVQIIDSASSHVQTIELNVDSQIKDEFITYYQGIKTSLPSNIILRESDLGNYWVRDYGPGFVINDYGQLGVVNWRYRSTRQSVGSFGDYSHYLRPGSFYSSGVEGYPYTYFTHHFPHVSEYIDCGGYKFEGGNWQLDGNGFGYTTNIVPLPVQNELKLRYGVQDVRVIPPLPQYDETKHIDMFVYIASPDTVIVASFPEDPPHIRDNGELFDTNHKVAEYAAAKFSEWGFTNVLRVYTPSLGGQITSTRTFAYSYTNALVMNGLVLIPYYSEFGSWNQNTKAIFETAFPGRIVEQVNSSEIIKIGGGTIHCITLTRPEVP